MIYGYGCIATTKLLRGDKEALLKTKTYTALKELFVKEGFPIENIHVDLITGSYRKRNEFHWILQNAVPDDVVVITSLSVLGNEKEAKENYRALYVKNIALMVVPDDSHITAITNKEEKAHVTAMMDRMRSFSTAANYKPVKKLAYKGKDLPDQIKENLENIGEILSFFKSHQGRPFTERPPHYKEVYWLYENYFLAESKTYHNPLIDMGKKRFHRLASEYELDPEYAKDLEEQHRLYCIGDKPKRHGAVPKKFSDFLILYDNGERLSTACKKTDQHFTSRLEVQRVRIKADGGREAMAKANKLKDTAFAKEIVERAFAKGDLNKTE